MSKKLPILAKLPVFAAVFSLILGLFLFGTVQAQTSPDIITGVSPPSAAQGDTGVTVTITLDSESPPTPPTDAALLGVTIDSVEATSYSRDSLTQVTALFDFPADATLGVQDLSLTFEGPSGSPLTFTASSAFEILPGGPSASLVITKTVKTLHTPVLLGDVVTYTIVVANDGDADTDVTVTDTLPAGVTGDDLAWTGTIVAGDLAAFTIPGTATINLTYPIVDTAQAACYDDDGAEITCPTEGEAFYGQDAQYTGTMFAFADNGDSTVTDNVTDLMWQQIPSNSQYSWADAQTYCESLSLAGHDDWRVPSLKELFSISDFETGWPYLDTDYFSLVNAPELKQQQYWSSNHYEVGTTHGGLESAFGVNHGTGHIKAYPDGSDGVPMSAKYVRCVRGDDYAVNDFVDNGDGTITDNATGLMWLQDDSGIGVDWENALAYADGFSFAGYDDWRVPNIKELQSIVEYSGVYPAIDLTYFNVTDEDAYFWSSTSAYFGPGSPGYFYGWYVAFGYAVGGDGEDLHGAGAVRFDIKAEGNPAGEDPERIYNYVRLVRDAEPAAEPEYTIYLPLVTNGEAGDGAGDISGYNLFAPLLDYSGLPPISQ